MYERELEALKRAGRFRQRRIFDKSLKDFASNDYLGLAHNPDILKRAYQRVKSYGVNSAKASQLINGYTEVHKEFEDKLKSLNRFEDAITVGSGFLANMALIEALVRRGDTLFIDEEFHASGNLAAKLIEGGVVRFKHNSAEDLRKKLSGGGYKRPIIAVEGIYSMSGDLLNRDIFGVAEEFGALLIVDEAHSSGVVGEEMLGVFDLFGIHPAQNHIKMGTLGKAYGSYGAYILASKEIVSFLENRAKSIIYTTAPSLMDVALAHEGVELIERKRSYFKEEIEKRRSLAKRFGIDMSGLIIDVELKGVLKVQEELLKKGFLVGAIRPPTVKRELIRVIARVGESLESLEELLECLSVKS